MTSFNSLPDEVVLKIIKMAAQLHPTWPHKYDHQFLVAVLCRVSIRFRKGIIYIVKINVGNLEAFGMHILIFDDCDNSDISEGLRIYRTIHVAM